MRLSDSVKLTSELYMTKVIPRPSTHLPQNSIRTTVPLSCRPASYLLESSTFLTMSVLTRSSNLLRLATFSGRSTIPRRHTTHDAFAALNVFKDASLAPVEKVRPLQPNPKCPSSKLDFVTSNTTLCRPAARRRLPALALDAPRP